MYLGMVNAPRRWYAVGRRRSSDHDTISLPLRDAARSSSPYTARVRSRAPVACLEPVPSRMRGRRSDLQVTGRNVRQPERPTQRRASQRIRCRHVTRAHGPCAALTHVRVMCSGRISTVDSNCVAAPYEHAHACSCVTAISDLPVVVIDPLDTCSRSWAWSNRPIKYSAAQARMLYRDRRRAVRSPIASVVRARVRHPRRDHACRSRHYGSAAAGRLANDATAAINSAGSIGLAR